MKTVDQITAMIAEDRDQLKTELTELVLSQLASTRQGLTLNGLELQRLDQLFTVPEGGVVTDWANKWWPVFEVDGLALASPGNEWQEVTKLIADARDAAQDFKALGIPGLARADLAAQVAQWVAQKFGTELSRKLGRPLPWWFPLFTSGVLPALVKAAYLQKYGGK